MKQSAFSIEDGAIYTIGSMMAAGSVYYGWKWASGAIDSGVTPSETYLLPGSVASPLTRSLYKTYVMGFLLYPTGILAAGIASDAVGVSRLALQLLLLPWPPTRDCMPRTKLQEAMNLSSRSSRRRFGCLTESLPWGLERPGFRCSSEDEVPSVLVTAQICTTIREITLIVTLMPNQVLHAATGIHWTFTDQSGPSRCFAAVSPPVHGSSATAIPSCGILPKTD